MSLTRQEVFQALADGKEIELKLKNADRVLSLDDDNYHLLHDLSFNEYIWDVKWYEKVSEHNRLGWVSQIHEKPNSSNSVFTIITATCMSGNNRYFVDYYGHKWKYVTLLTNEEIKQFLTGE